MTASTHAEPTRDMGAGVPDLLRTLVDALAAALAPMVAEQVAARMQPAPAVNAPGALLTKKELATTLGVSTATVDRLTREGLRIAAYVGDARRFDLEACRTWLTARGKRPTKSPPRSTSRSELDEVARSAGLRRA